MNGDEDDIVHAYRNTVNINLSVSWKLAHPVRHPSRPMAHRTTYQPNPTMERSVACDMTGQLGFHAAGSLYVTKLVERKKPYSVVVHHLYNLLK